MLKIRLKRIGRRHQPFYRIVVTEHTKAINSDYLVKVGHYNPLTKELVLDTELATEWMNKGARPTNTVSKLFQKEGLKHKLIEIKIFKTKSKTQIEAEKKEKEAEKAKEQAEKEAKKVEFEEKVAEEKAEKEEAASEETAKADESTDGNTEKAPEATEKIEG